MIRHPGVHPNPPVFKTGGFVLIYGEKPLWLADSFALCYLGSTARGPFVFEQFPNSQKITLFSWLVFDIISTDFLLNGILCIPNRKQSVNPKYIFSAVIAVSILMGLLLPNLARPVAALPASGAAVAADPASAVPSPAAEVASAAPVTDQGAAAAFVAGAVPLPTAEAATPTPTAIPRPLPEQALPEQPVVQANVAAGPETAPVFNPPPPGQPTPTPIITLQGVIPLTAEAQAEVDRFAAALINNNPQAVTGIYVPGLFALPVVEQPGGEEAFVSPNDQTLTQYATPSRYGTTGILAHNYLSGKTFFRLKQGQMIVVTHGDGRKSYYEVTGMQSYQAISPHDPRSDFVDLTDPTYRVLHYSDVFNRVYTTSGQLVFQTCIEANGELSWGRLFVMAKPVSPPQGFSN